MLDNCFTSPDTALYLVESLTAVGTLLASAEVLWNPRPLRDEGLMSWEVLKLRHRWLCSGRLGRALDAPFSYPSVVGLHGLRLGAAAGLLMGVEAEWLRGCLTGVVVISSLGQYLRCPYGLDGADQMMMITMSAATAAHFVSGIRDIVFALWFIALQSVLSYVTAGVSKAASRAWRDGTALVGILKTEIYGHSLVVSVLERYPALSRLVGWMVIGWEVGFVLTLVAPPPVPLFLVALGCWFHLGSAAVMGLNTFFWAFVATYPAVLYCACSVRF